MGVKNIIKESTTHEFSSSDKEIYECYDETRNLVGVWCIYYDFRMESDFLNKVKAYYDSDKIIVDFSWGYDGIISMILEIYNPKQNIPTESLGPGWPRLGE